MGVGVPFGGNNGHFAIRINTKEAVGAGDRLQGVNGNSEAAIGSILKADRGGET